MPPSPSVASLLSSLVKAEIINLDTRESVRCMFNPKEYSVRKGLTWSRKPAPGTNVPRPTFDHGQPASFSLDLLFDTYVDSRATGTPKDVRREYTDKLWKMLMVDDKLKGKKSRIGRPPRVRFQWGRAWSFNAVITQMSQTFTLFLPDGTPVRAKVQVTFEQEQDSTQLAAQNPTSGGVGGDRLWTVIEGDTLGWIAYKEYGDSSKWRAIADANRLGQLRRLRPGTVLVIPNG